MNQPNESFQRDLNELIRLLKIVKADPNNQRFDSIDPFLKQHIDFIINNYEMFKSNIHTMPLDMMEKVLLPFQQMLRQFLEMMKSDLGEDVVFDKIADRPRIDLISPLDNIPNIDVDERIRLIDEMLKRPGLAPGAIDHLLDERNQLLKKS